MNLKELIGKKVSVLYYGLNKMESQTGKVVEVTDEWIVLETGGNYDLLMIRLTEVKSILRYKGEWKKDNV
jgi:RNase P/RNase MRP subunit p29